MKRKIKKSLQRPMPRRRRRLTILPRKLPKKLKYLMKRRKRSLLKLRLLPRKARRRLRKPMLKLTKSASWPRSLEELRKSKALRPPSDKRLMLLLKLSETTKIK